MFFALRLPEHWHAILNEAQHGIEGARWTKTENFHLTLLFLGSVAQDTSKQLIYDLHQHRCPAPELRVQGVGVFPSTERPRVLWAGVEANADLFSLHQHLVEHTQAVGITLQERSYTPHITLARIRRHVVQVKQWQSHYQTLSTELFRPTTFELMEKRKSQKHHFYYTLARFPLGSRWGH